MVPSVLLPESPSSSQPEIKNQDHSLLHQNADSKLAEIMQTESQYSLPGMPPLPISMVRGSGAYLYDTTSKRYIDFNAGFSSCNQGHCHPRIVAAMIAQCQTITLPSRVVYNSDYGKLCKKVCEVSFPRGLELWREGEVWKGMSGADNFMK